MDIVEFNALAKEVKATFELLREQLVDYASSPEGYEALKSIDDPSVLRKLLRFPGDITPARLVSVSNKLLEKKQRA
jgi:hypothetical protein